jgi:hypothetical protein
VLPAAWPVSIRLVEPLEGGRLAPSKDPAWLGDPAGLHEIHDGSKASKRREMWRSASARPATSGRVYLCESLLNGVRAIPLPAMAHRRCKTAGSARLSSANTFNNGDPLVLLIRLDIRDGRYQGFFDRVIGRSLHAERERGI